MEILNQSPKPPRSIFLLFFILTFNAVAAPLKVRGLYVNTVGDPAKPAVIYIHGGPAYNSWDFELTTAPRLAALGFYVVVYDERGQGRSAAVRNTDYNYKLYAEDLKAIIDQLKIKSPVLIGHSHGGVIALKFDQRYPGVARKIILVSAPLNYWGSVHALFENCFSHYQAAANDQGLKEVTSLYYQLFLDPKLKKEKAWVPVLGIFKSTFRCGVYRTKAPTAQEIACRKGLQEHPFIWMARVQAKSDLIFGGVEYDCLLDFKLIFAYWLTH